MSSTVEIDGKEWIAIKDAAQVVSYSRDHLTRHAREGKIEATQVARQWFVDPDSVEQYAMQAAAEQAARRERLSEERKREQQLQALTERHASKVEQRVRTLHPKAVAVAAFVMMMGVLGGAIVNTLFHLSLPSVQLAATYSADQNDALAAQAIEASAGEASVAFAATEGSDVSELLTSTSSVRSLGDAQDGVLLLPQATTTVGRLFSDEVIVAELPDGTQVVYQIDEDGVPFGKPIPFVEVPVTRTVE